MAGLWLEFELGVGLGPGFSIRVSKVTRATDDWPLYWPLISGLSMAHGAMIYLAAGGKMQTADLTCRPAKG